MPQTGHTQARPALADLRRHMLGHARLPAEQKDAGPARLRAVQQIAYSIHRLVHPLSGS